MTEFHITDGKIADTIYTYLNERFPASAPFEPDTELLEGGIIDSLGFLELMVFLGESFGIELEDDQFTPENLSTPSRLIAFAAKMQK